MVKTVSEKAKFAIKKSTAKKSTAGVLPNYSRAKKRRISRSSRVVRSAKTYGYFSEMENKEVENAICTLYKLSK